MITTGGQVFTGLVWKRTRVKGELVSGPYRVTPLNEGKLRRRFFASFSDGTARGFKVLAHGVTSAEAQKVCNDNARAALVFGARPVKVTP